MADLEHRLLDCSPAVHDAQVEERVPDDTTGFDGYEKEAAATLTVVLEHQRQLPMPSLHPMKAGWHAPTSRPR